MSHPDQDLLEAAIARTRAGDVDAFDEVVRQCHWPLRCWLAARCPSEIDPDEIAHLAFLTAFRSLAEYREQTRFRSWLWTIARNQLLAQLTANRRAASMRAGYLPEAVRQRIAGLIDDAADADDSYLAALRTCLARLSPLARGIIDRHYRDGSPLADIAAEIRSSPGAVKKQLFTIRRFLRNCIEQVRSSP